MTAPVEILVLGAVVGLTYALLGVGLSLIYKTSRVLNFAHGEIGALPAIIVPVLAINQDLPYWLALATALVASTLAGALTEFLVVRRLARAPRLIVLVATIGVAQLFFAINRLIPKEGRLGQFAFPTPFDAVVTIGELRLGSGHILILAAVPAITIALAAWLQRSRIGMASRAAADNSDAAQLVGVPVHRISLVVWSLAGFLAGASAILIGPTRPIATEVALGPGLMVRALAAAMIGGLTNLRHVFLAGVGLGVVEALVLWNWPSGGVLEIVLFAVILMSLVLRARQAGPRSEEGTSWSLAGVARDLEPHLAGHPRVRRARWVGIGALVVLATAIALPLGASHRILLASIVLFATMALSLVVLTGFAGQISLGQFSFVGVGALVGGRLGMAGYPPLAAFVYAVAAGGLAALVVGVPALRLRGLNLAVTTLAFAVAAQTWLYNQDWLVAYEGALTSLVIERPVILGISFRSELAYYWLCLFVLIAVAALVHRLRVTGLGRTLMAVRDNAPHAAALGVSPRRAKLVAFVLAGMIAAGAGYLYGGLLVTFTDPRTFGPELSLSLVAMAIVGGITSITGAVAGAAWVLGIAYFIGPLLPGLIGSEATVVISGLGLVVVVLQFPGGIATVLFALRDRVAARLVEAAESPQARDAQIRVRLPRRAQDAEAPSLRAEDVVVRFGGNVALDGVRIDVGAGEVVGLVGPNGAGKTTLFDVLSGHLSPNSGRVLLDDEDVTWMRPEELARLGMARTFQQARLFEDLTLLEALQVALERSEPSEVVPSLLGLPPARRAERAKLLRAAEVLELLGLESYERRLVSELSTGMRRLAELGCAVGLGARLLLLDEPTAGIAQREVEAFQPVIRELQHHLGATVVLIDHDIPMVSALADRLYVLAAGRVIAHGRPEAIRRDPAVVEAYLGTDERVIQRSGRVRTKERQS